MPRIFLPDEQLSPGTIAITGEKGRYLTTVLRMKAGDALSVKDGSGVTFLSKVVGIARRTVTVELLSETTHCAESELRLNLVQGLLKGEKMDLVVQKAAELGVHAIMPVVAERSQVRATRKAERWRKIAEEAARQCGRDRIPAVADAAPLTDFLDSGIRPGLVFWEEGGLPLRETLKRLASEIPLSSGEPLHILIGPEGGLSAGEVEHAAARGFIVASLGPRTLRAETAAITALSVIQYALGDLGA